MLQSAPTKAALGSLKPVLENASLSVLGPQGACFPASDVCNVSLGFVFDLTSSLNAKMQYRSLRVGEMQNCVSFDLCDSLNVFLKYVLSGVLFCITALATWLS